MIEKLEFKHINGYVPYKVECDKGLIVGSILDDAVLIEGRPRNIEFIGDISLFLRPLSDLTKEIEHDGERFVPMDQLAKLTELNTTHYEIRYEYMNFTLFDKADEVYKINDNNFYLMEKLYEWHFDIHGLIESGLAVDLNTLSK